MQSRTTAGPPDSLQGSNTTADTATSTEEDEHKSAEDVAEIYAGTAEKADRWAWLDRLFPGPLRRRLFGDADGRVLDVACGTGPNFRYLPEPVELVGIDLSEEMVAKARDNLDALGRGGVVRQMDAQALEFPDDSFDTVISSLSTCTFPDPVVSLHEMNRVCRPDGRILLLEHGQSSVGPVARIIDWRADAHYEKVGCRLNQEPLELVREAGLPVLEARKSFLGTVTAIEAAPRDGRRVER